MKPARRAQLPGPLGQPAELRQVLGGQVDRQRRRVGERPGQVGAGRDQGVAAGGGDGGDVDGDRARRTRRAGAGGS